jgi:prepilin-type N-terminal cleavage/methylation domain-containing protein
MKRSSILQPASGFTLVELAIVLTIIGLVAAGVLAGRTLLRQSQVNSVMIDVRKYITATKEFRTKYGSLPGDMANAVDYWGAAGGDSSDNYTTTCYSSGSATSTATCNGNGDGNIGFDDYSVSRDEKTRVWQHLANAEMIQGKFTGGVMGEEHVIGENCPASRVDNGGFGLGYYPWFGESGGIEGYFAGIYRHSLAFGGSGSVLPHRPALTTSEAQSLDNKHDDGKPALGSLRVFANPMGNNCTIPAAVDAGATYNTAATDLQCALIFITGF